MASSLIVRFRPAGPWRLGPPSGAADRVDAVLGSDALYSALTLAMRDLGWMDEWLQSTAQAANPAVRITSCFPYVWRTLLIAPPRNLWPPAQTGKVRWSAARFVPAPMIRALLRDEDIREDRWSVDSVTECLLPIEKSGTVTPPFRLLRSARAAVDRISGASSEMTSVTGIQFAAGAGMWFAAAIEDDGWRDRIKAACRLLADTGLGGERSRGWGRSEAPLFEDASLADLLLRDVAGVDGGETAYWLLSLFNPADSDTVDWNRGNYGIVTRSGRVHGDGALKMSTRMVAEGSVLLSAAPPTGTARNVAPDGSAHPVYRAGFAYALPLPWRETHRLSWLGADRTATAAETATAETEPRPEEAVKRSDEREQVSGEDETPAEPAPGPDEVTAPFGHGSVSTDEPESAAAAPETEPRPEEAVKRSDEREQVSRADEMPADAESAPPAPDEAEEKQQ